MNPINVWLCSKKPGLKSTFYVEYNSINNSIFTENKKVYLLGVKNLIVVSQKTKILILKKGESEKVKHLSKKWIQYNFLDN